MLLEFIIISGSFPTNIRPDRGLFVLKNAQGFNYNGKAQTIFAVSNLQKINREIVENKLGEAPYKAFRHLNFGSITGPVKRLLLLISINISFFLFYLRNNLWKSRNAIVYVHFYHPVIYLVSMLKFLGFKRLCVAITESDIDWVDEGDVRRLNSVPLIIVPTRDRATILKNIGVRSKIAVIQNCVDNIFFSDQSCNVKTKEKKLLLIGAIIERKGQRDFLCELVDQGLHNEYKVIVYGSGFEKLKKEFEFIAGAEWISPDKLVSEMKSSHAMIHPSRREGMANVVLEATAARLPVICRPIPSNVEIFGNDYNLYYGSKPIRELLNLANSASVAVVPLSSRKRAELIANEFS